MASKIKNIIIFSGIAIALVLVYIYFIKGDPDESGSFLSAEPNTALPSRGASADSSSFAVTQEFLSLLLNVRSIKIDDSIFSDNAFLSLRDSTILLIPDGNEGRPNPFAPIGSDVLVVPSQ